MGRERENKKGGERAREWMRKRGIVYREGEGETDNRGGRKQELKRGGEIERERE